LPETHGALDDLDRVLREIAEDILHRTSNQRWVTEQILKELGLGFLLYWSGHKKWATETTEIGGYRLGQITGDVLWEQYHYGKTLFFGGEGSRATKAEVNHAPTSSTMAPPPRGWSDIEIRFIDGNTVAITTAGQLQRTTYAEMGMKNKKNGQPTVQWGALRSFAEGHGRFGWHNPSADPKAAKRVENLGKALSNFFGIKESPFHPYERGTGWSAKFVIAPER
jgi:hypothetical protein